MYPQDKYFLSKQFHSSIGIYLNFGFSVGIPLITPHISGFHKASQLVSFYTTNLSH